MPINSFRGEQVEPPEDKDVADYIVDPRMTVLQGWSEGKSAKLEPEEDLDDRHHPSMADLKRRVAEQHTFSLDDNQAVNLFSEKKYQEPEADVDDVAHPVYDPAREELVERLTDVLLVDEKEVSADFQPEVDMDDLYHDKHPQAAPHLQHGEEAAVPVDVSSRESYDNSQPKVDLNYIYDA